MKAACILALITLSLACFFLPMPTFDKHFYATAVSGNPSIPDYAVQYEYQRELHDNPRLVYAQIPFYSIRALYILTAQSLYFAGLSPLRALGLISALGYLACGLLLMRWTQEYLLSLLAMLAPAMLYIGRSLTPDAMTSVLILSAFYAYHRKMVGLACSLLTVCVWVRTDTVILLAFFLLALTVLHQIKLRYAAALLSLGVASVLFLNHFSGNYGYAVLFVNSFVHHVANPGEIQAHVTLPMYIHQLTACLRGMFAGSTLAIFIGLGVFAWRRTENRVALMVIAATLAAKIALYPIDDERYFTPLYLVVTALAMFSLRRYSSLSQSPSPLPSESLSSSELVLR